MKTFFLTFRNRINSIIIITKHTIKNNVKITYIDKLLVNFVFIVVFVCFLFNRLRLSFLFLATGKKNNNELRQRN